MVPVAYSLIFNSMLKLENDTYKNALGVQIEYFVDSEKYFLYEFLHLFFTFCILGLISAAGGLVYLVGIHHIVGIFNAIECALDI